MEYWSIGKSKIPHFLARKRQNFDNEVNAPFPDFDLRIFEAQNQGFPDLFFIFCE